VMGQHAMGQHAMGQHAMGQPGLLNVHNSMPNGMAGNFPTTMPNGMPNSMPNGMHAGIPNSINGLAAGLQQSMTPQPALSQPGLGSSLAPLPQMLSSAAMGQGLGAIMPQGEQRVAHSAVSTDVGANFCGSFAGCTEVPMMSQSLGMEGICPMGMVSSMASLPASGLPAMVPGSEPGLLVQHDQPSLACMAPQAPFVDRSAAAEVASSPAIIAAPLDAPSYYGADAAGQGNQLVPGTVVGVTSYQDITV